MINRSKSKIRLIYLAIAVIVLLMLIFGKSSKEDIAALEKEVGLEKNTGSGFLEVETIPSDADVYVDGILKGKSPGPFYSIPVGIHNIVIKKEGYTDYSADVNVEAGKKAFIEADLLVEIKEEMPKAEEIIESVKETEEPETIENIKDLENGVEEKKENIAQEPSSLEGNNTINIGKQLQFYYDFSDKKFTDSRNIDYDVFSRRFDTYLVFTRFSPVNIKTINKKIENVNKEDCINVKGTFEYLYSGRSLCIITKEGKIAATGGYWENTENAALNWKVFS